MVILRQSGESLPKFRQKRCFVSFETYFTAFTILFWALVFILRLSDLRLKGYARKRCFANFKTGFKAFAVLLKVFWLYFGSIWCTVAKIQAKTLLRQFSNRIDGIRRSFLSTLVVILRQSDVPLPKYWLNRCFIGFETGFMAFAIHFLSALVVILCLSNVPLPIYGKYVVLPALKPDLQYSPFFFGHFSGYFALIRHTIAKI